MLYVLNPNVRLQKFDECARRDRWLCELEGPGGPFRCVVPRTVMQWLKRFESPCTWASAAENVEPSESREIPWARAIDYFVRRNVLLEVGGSGGERSGRPAIVRRSYVQLRRPVLDGALVESVAQRLRWLHRRPAVVMTLLVAFLAHVEVYAGGGNLAEALDGLSVRGLACLFILSMVAAIWHELGHATAFVRHGGRRPEIGVGLYAVWPVFYTDVTTSWRFARSQRIQVDVGGVYFDLVLISVLWMIGLVWGMPGYAVAILLLDMSIVVNLNPLLRMDGFWLLNDLAGSAGLRREGWAAAKMVVRRWWHGFGREEERVEIGRRGAFMAIYGVLTVIVFVVLYVRVVSFVMLDMMPDIGSRFGRMMETPMAGGDMAAELLVVGWRAVIVLAIWWHLGTVIARGATGLRRAG